MSNPRTPRYFPRIKVRGARRRRRAPFERLSGSVDRLTAAFARFSVAIAALPPVVIEATERNEEVR